MPHEEKFQEKLKVELTKKQNRTPLSLWNDVIIYSILVFIVVSLYYFVQRGEYNVILANRALADVSILLIGLSFALSGICYYWNFADHFIIYRKQLGVVGFSLAVIHSLYSLFLLPEAKPLLIYYFQSENIIPFVSAVIALLIYAGMVLVSTKYVIQHIGGAMWRKLLRVGYIAFVLSILHFGLQSYPYWLRWLTGQSTNIFPSFGLITFFFGFAVIILRVVLWISLAGKKPTNTPSNNGQENT